MRQGRATHSGMGSTKVEPSPRAVSPAAVADIGIKKGNHASDAGVTVHATSRPMYEGRTLQAPKSGTTVHQKGSQGTHK